MRLGISFGYQDWGVGLPRALARAQGGDRRRYPAGWVSEAFGTDERFRAQDRDDLTGTAGRMTYAFGVDLRDPVRADTVHRIGLEQRMVIGHAVDRCRGDVYDSCTVDLARNVEDRARAVDIDRVNLARRIERERRGRMHDDVATSRRAQHVGVNANVPAYLDDARALGVVERFAIE